MNATEVLSALRIHYGDGYRLVEQVADHTGYRASRWLDAMAFGLWPSRGLEIHGIEVKVSRPDFRREIENPQKADATAARCDRFFLAAPAGIVDPLHLETLAPTWGLLEVVADKTGNRTVRTTKRAERIEQRKPIDRDFLAAVLRRIPSPTDELRGEIRAEIESANELAIERAVENRLARSTGDCAVLRELVGTFEAAAGIKLTDYHSFGGGAERSGRALRLLADELGGWESARHRLRGVADTAQRRGEDIEAAIGRIRELVDALDDVLGTAVGARP
ncbi:MAG: hypothetical protein V1912_11305 [bacterium]